MNRFLMALAGATLAVGAVAASNPTSGLQPGGTATAFYVFDVSGPSAGKAAHCHP